MIRRLSITSMQGALQRHIQRLTGIKCLDAVELNEPAPFYFVELVSVVPKNTKNVLVDSFTVYLHCIAEKTAPEGKPEGSKAIYTLIQKAQESLTEDLNLEQPFEVLTLFDDGVESIFTEESGEKHAVIRIEINVSYGFICK